MSAEEAGVLKALPYDEVTAKIFCASMLRVGLDPAVISRLLHDVIALRDGREVEPILSASIAAFTHPASEGCPKGWQDILTNLLVNSPSDYNRYAYGYRDALEAVRRAFDAPAPSIPEGE